MARSGGGISSQFSSLVTDTKGLIAETEVATTALNFFLVCCFFFWCCFFSISIFSSLLCSFSVDLVLLTIVFLFSFVLFFSSFLKHRFSFQSSSWLFVHSLVLLALLRMFKRMRWNMVWTCSLELFLFIYFLMSFFFDLIPSRDPFWSIFFLSFLQVLFVVSVWLKSKRYKCG